MRIVSALLILAVAAVALWTVGPTLADGPSTVTLQPLPPSAQPSGQESVILSARLSDAKGPVGGEPVTFYIVTNVFGERLMKVGQALTDATGMASVAYQPSWAGDHTVVARFGGGADYAATQASFHFSALNPVSQFQSAQFGLEPVRRWLPLAVGLLVLAVWASLGFALITTAAGIRAAGAGTTANQPVTIPAFRPPRPASLARPLLVLVAVLALAALPAMWLLGRPGGPDDVSLSTGQIQLTSDGVQPNSGPQTSGGSGPVAQPLPATVVRSVQTMTFDAAGQPTPDSVGSPADVAVMAGRPRILDANKGRIVTVAADGKLASILDTQRSQGVSLRGATAMTGHDGKLYVAASQSGQIVVVDSAGGLADVIAPVVPSGQAPLVPAGIAVTDSGEIRLSDSGNHRVLFLNSRGEFELVIGKGVASTGPTGFNTPGGLALDEDGNLYVADTANGLVKKYSPLGVFLLAIGEGRLSLPTGVAIDGRGRILVSDEKAAVVSVFAPTGDYLGSIGAGQLQAPHSVKVDGDLIYVMDRLAGLFAFRPEGAAAGGS